MSVPALDEKLITRELRLGFWKLHILHHAAEQPVVGQWMLGELRHHGYDLSPGTLYPLLKRMERNGWLRSEVETTGGLRARRYYHLTRAGRQVLDTMVPTIRELYDELVKERFRRPAGRARRRGPRNLAGRT